MSAGKLLVEQVKAVLLMTQAIERTRQKLQTHRDQVCFSHVKSVVEHKKIKAKVNDISIVTK